MTRISSNDLVVILYEENAWEHDGQEFSLMEVSNIANAKVQLRELTRSSRIGATQLANLNAFRISSPKGRLEAADDSWVISEIANHLKGVSVTVKDSQVTEHSVTWLCESSNCTNPSVCGVLRMGASDNDAYSQELSPFVDVDGWNVSYRLLQSDDEGYLKRLLGFERNGEKHEIPQPASGDLGPGTHEIHAARKELLCRWQESADHVVARLSSRSKPFMTCLNSPFFPVGWTGVSVVDANLTTYFLLVFCTGTQNYTQLMPWPMVRRFGLVDLLRRRVDKFMHTRIQRNVVGNAHPDGFPQAYTNQLCSMQIPYLKCAPGNTPQRRKGGGRRYGECSQNIYGCTNRGCVVDHVIPRSLGGEDKDENMQLLCEMCHNQKTRIEREVWYNNKEEFPQSVGELLGRAVLSLTRSVFFGDAKLSDAHLRILLHDVGFENIPKDTLPSRINTMSHRTHFVVPATVIPFGVSREGTSREDNMPPPGSSKDEWIAYLVENVRVRFWDAASKVIFDWKDLCNSAVTAWDFRDNNPWFKGGVRTSFELDDKAWTTLQACM